MGAGLGCRAIEVWRYIIVERNNNNQQPSGIILAYIGNFEASVLQALFRLHKIQSPEGTSWGFGCLQKLPYSTSFCYSYYK